MLKSFLCAPIKTYSPCHLPLVMIKENIGIVSTFGTGTTQEAPMIVLPSNHSFNGGSISAGLVWTYLLILNKSGGGYHRVIHITEHRTLRGSEEVLMEGVKGHAVFVPRPLDTFLQPL